MSDVNEELKKCEIEMLIEFDQVCKKLGIKYFLIGGALIGAIRHKGFIPWDDDIDVGMLRSDYDKFIEFGQDLFPDKYFVQTRKTDPEYLNYFCKIRNSQTTFLETRVKNRNINHGIFIDVFPFDYYPENENEARKLEKLWNECVKRLSVVYYTRKKISKHYFKTFAKAIPMIIKYPSVKRMLDKRDNILSSVSKTSIVRNWGGAWGEKEMVNIDWISNVTTQKFDNISVSVPIEWDKWLTHVYGDYMKLPPEKDRRTYHYSEVIDANKPYTHYFKQVKRC